jgi:hypothetical protein
MAAYADVTNLTEMLKTVYGEGITNQFNDEVTLYNRIPKSGRKPAGKGYVFGIRYARTQSVGARAESTPLPDPFTGKKDQGTILPKYNYGAIRLTGPAVDMAKGNMAAFADGLADEMDDIYNSILVDLNRQMQGDGFGLIATTSAAATPATNATWAATCDNDTGVLYVMEGMLVDFFQSTAIDESCVAQRVLSVDSSNKVITFETSGDTYQTNHPLVAARSYTNGTGSVASGSLIIKMGMRAATHATTNTQYEIIGLDGIFDDSTLLTTFEDINASTNQRWRANIISNSSVKRELSVDMMLAACDLTRQKSGVNPDLMIMGLGQRRKYANLLLPDVRFQPSRLEGGYEYLAFAAGNGAVELMVEPLAQKNKIYVQKKGNVQKYELTPLGWGNLDGDQMHQRAGYDEWDLFLRIYTQIGTEHRASLTKITDLVEPSDY